MAGFFARKRLPEYYTPGGGIGGGQPGMPMGMDDPEMDPAMMDLQPEQIDASVPVDPYAGERPEGRTGFFGKARDWLHDNKGTISDIASVMMADPEDSGIQMQRQRGDERLEGMRGAREEASEQRRRADQFDTYGDAETGFFGRDGLGKITELLAGRGPKKTQAQQDFEYRQALPEDQRAAFDPMTRGYQYTDPGIAALGRQAEQRAAAGERHRAPPRPTAPRYEYRTNPQTGQVQRKRVG